MDYSMAGCGLYLVCVASSHNFWSWLTRSSVWLIFFTDSLQQQISGSLLPYVTSSFGFHGLLATTSIVSNIVAGVSKLPLARIIDVVGRVEGFLIMLFMVVLGERL